MLALMAAQAACQSARDDSRVRLLDLDDRSVDPLAPSQAAARVFIFTRADCPISNRYAPTIHQLQADFEPRGVEFILVYPDPDATPMSIRDHMAAYALYCTALRDPRHKLVELTGAAITPEAAVFDRDANLIYCGRIDDWYVDFGKSRAMPSSHDLRNAVEAALDGSPVAQRRVPAVGCLIADLRPRAAGN